MKRLITTIVVLGIAILSVNPMENTSFAQNENKEEIVNKVEVIDILNKEQAEELLKVDNGKVNYSYQGDENQFEALAKKGLEGYVFLPDYETDLGLFVEKNTGDIYYFHPSGYLEKK